MAALFNFYGSPKKLSEIASDTVHSYRLDREKKIENAKNVLIGPHSPMRIQILEAASNGELSVTIDLYELNNRYKLGNNSFKFSNKEIDRLIIKLIDYLESEGFNYSAMAFNELTQLKITWPDPDLDFDLDLTYVDTYSEV